MHSTGAWTAAGWNSPTCAGSPFIAARVKSHHAGSATAIFFGNLGQRHPAAAVIGEGLTVNVERCPAKPEAFESPSGHPLANALTSQNALKPADASNQGQKEPPRRPGGVDGLLDRDELDAKAIKLVKGLEEMAGASGNAVECGHQRNRELTATGVGHEGVKPRSPGLGAGIPQVLILADYLQPTLRSKLMQLAKLGRDVWGRK